MQPPAPAPEPPSLADLVLTVARVGLSSFGGGISGWLLRVVVYDKRWMDEAEFLSGLAVCQVFPGVNVVNISIWLGYRLHGGVGALLAALAMVVPPAIIMVAVASSFSALSHQPLLQAAMAGAAAAAIGLGASTGLRAGLRARRPVPFLLMAATILGVGILRLPMLWVVLPLLPVAVLTAWFRPA